MKREKLTCQDLNAFLAAYLDDRLDEPLKQKFTQHLQQCGHCIAYVEQYRQMTQLVKEADECPDDPPEELVETTLDFLRSRMEGRPGSGNSR